MTPNALFQLYVTQSGGSTFSPFVTAYFSRTNGWLLRNSHTLISTYESLSTDWTFLSSGIPVEYLENFENYGVGALMLSNSGTPDWDTELYTAYWGNEYFSENFESFSVGPLSSIATTTWPTSGNLYTITTTPILENFETYSVGETSGTFGPWSDAPWSL